MRATTAPNDIWKLGSIQASGVSATNLTLKVEILGAAHNTNAPTKMLQQDVKPGGWFSHWAYLQLSREDYATLGEVTAWRATLWDGDRMLGKQESFLW